MSTKPILISTIVISVAVANLIFALSASAKGPGGSMGRMGGGVSNTNGQHETIFNPPPPSTGGTKPQAGTGTTVANHPDGSYTLTTVVSNYDGKHGEKVITSTYNSQGEPTGLHEKTVDANGKCTSGC